MTSKTKDWLLFTGVVVYFFGLGATINYFQSNNVDPYEVCAGLDRTTQYYPYPGDRNYFRQSSEFLECVHDNDQDEAIEILASLIWPVTLPISMGLRMEL